MNHATSLAARCFATAVLASCAVPPTAFAQAARHVATWPVDEAKARQEATQWLDGREQLHRKALADWLADQRMPGAPDAPALKARLAEYAAQRLAPHVRSAGTACKDGQDAIAQWLAFWRHAQSLGAGDGWSITIDGKAYASARELPEPLAAGVEACVQEDTRHCIASGDFMRLLGRMSIFDAQMRALGRELEPAWIRSASEQLQRCSQWELDVTTRFRSRVRDAGVWATGTVRRTIALAWRPGRDGGMAALYGGRIEGTAEPRVEQISFSGACPVTRGPLMPMLPATAALRHVAWEYREDPAGAPAWATTGHPGVLAVALQPGSALTSLSFTCPEDQAPSPHKVPFLFDGEIVSAAMVERGLAQKDTDDAAGTGDASARPVVFRSGWEFTVLNPLRARLQRDTAQQGDGLGTSARLEMELRHTPK